VPFEFSETPLPGVLLVTPRRFPDDRGWFAETYKQSDFRAAGITQDFVQDNHSVSAAGTVRGLHYQLPPHGQGKLVRVVAGRVWDVAVDIRRGLASYGSWEGFELSAENGMMLYIPAGFAHGFVALVNDTHLVYKCTAEYHHESDRAIRWNDATIGIDWPVLPKGVEYRLSEKDSAASLLRDAEVYP